MGDENNEDRRPRDAELNQAGTLLYVLSADDTILVFDIAARGSLTLVNGSPFTVGQGSASMLAAAPPHNCSAAPNFDLRIQDDGSGEMLKIDSTTGDYLFTNCNGFTLGGTGRLRIRGCMLTLEDSRPDRRLQVKVDTCSKKASAALQIFSQGRTLTMTDRNTTNNISGCD